MTATLQRAQPKLRKLYSPPVGFYDLPMIWIYDASGLVNGRSYLNQAVPIYAGYGDFVMRRVVGLDRILNQVATNGTYQIRDAIGRYLESVPVTMGTIGLHGGTTQDIAIAPERIFKENTQIKFDLTGIQLKLDSGALSQFGAQIGFCGVRRFAGKSPLTPTYKYHPKTYTYVQTASLVPSGASLNPAVPVYTPVTDYDFELYNIELIYNKQASAGFAAEFTANMTFIAVPIGAAGNGIVIHINQAGVNTPFSLSVAGTTITIEVQTDSLGNSLTTGAQLAAAINNNLASAALITAIVLNNPTNGVVTGTYTTIGGGSALTPAAPNALCLLYDQHRIQVYSQAVCDMFINALSPYGNGAVVPPLLYAKDTVIHMDVTSLLGSQAASVIINYIGRQRIPC